MKLVLDATEVADQLTECAPGDQELLTVEVDSNDGSTITGRVTEVEHLTGEEAYAEEQPEGEVPPEEAPPEEVPTLPEAAVATRAKKRVPKAIVMISKAA